MSFALHRKRSCPNVHWTAAATLVTSTLTVLYCVFVHCLTTPTHQVLFSPPSPAASCRGDDMIILETHTPLLPLLQLLPKSQCMEVSPSPPPLPSSPSMYSSNIRSSQPLPLPPLTFQHTAPPCPHPSPHLPAYSSQPPPLSLPPSPLPTH